MRNRATQRRKTESVDPEVSILDFFFEKKVQGDVTVLVPRTDFVTREQMWWWGEWLTSRLPARNRWWMKLWRWLRRQPVVTIDPFAFTRAHPQIQVPAPKDEPKREPKKKIDATGVVVDT